MAERTRLDLGALGKQVGPSALRLFRGAVECHVPKLDENERFSVVTKDAEVVVHGTVFSVRVGDANEPSTCVRVEEGVVAVHHAHGVARITGGQSWGCDKVKVASTDRQPTPVVGLPVVMAEKSERTQEAAPASARHTRARAAQRPAVVERPEKTTPRGSAEETVVAVSEPREPVTSEDAAPVLSGTLAAENRLLTEALSAEQAGDASQARSLFSQLLARYPSSPLGPEARAGLARLR